MMTLGSCVMATANPFVHLDTVPKYDWAEVNEQYAEVQQLQNRYEATGTTIRLMAMSGVEFTEAHVKWMQAKEDGILYHKAVATAAMFHQQYDVMRQHLDKAYALLKEAQDFLDAIAKSQKSV